MVIILLEGFWIGVARTEVFRAHPLTFEEVVDVVLNAEFNFKAARYDTQCQNSSTVKKAEHMNLSHAEEVAELQVAEHNVTSVDLTRAEARSTFA